MDAGAFANPVDVPVDEADFVRPIRQAMQIELTTIMTIANPLIPSESKCLW